MLEWWKLFILLYIRKKYIPYVNSWFQILLLKIKVEKEFAHEINLPWSTHKKLWVHLKEDTSNSVS